MGENLVKPALSIIIPVLNEAAQITEVLRALQPYADASEIIVVDGGSHDQTVSLARQFSQVRVIQHGQAGRARQMNAGAVAASGAALLFLHADVRLPASFFDSLAEALRDERCVGGCFEFGFPDDVSGAFHVYAWGVTLRTRWGRTATGDQAIWARRAAFESIGGFRLIPLMEDIEFFAALKRLGRVAILPERVTVSPRRWQQHGLVRTGLLMYALRFGHWLGIEPATLKKFFLDVR